MKRRGTAIALVGLLITALAGEPALAWSHADRWGGSTSHARGSGSTTRTTGWGGSETHTCGQGTSATNRYGATATHAQGSGSTTFTNPYGGSATHTYGQGTTATSAYGDTHYLWATRGSSPSTAPTASTTAWCRARDAAGRRQEDGSRGHATRVSERGRPTQVRAAASLADGHRAGCEGTPAATDPA
jgi:hypothetical protein